MKDIAVVILNRIQYENIILGLKELKKHGYSVDIYCSDGGDDKSGFADMFNDIAEHCKSGDFTVYRKPDPNSEYKILLEPYPALNINAKYKIKYRYSNISAKPNIVYKPENYIMYDAILCSGDYDSNYLSVFSKTYKTANLKYHNFKKSELRKSNKKHLLYLPTYGEESSIEEIIDVLDDLKQQYYIIAKIHHGTNFLVNEHNRISLLKDKVDELHDSHTPLPELLKITDVILTDNSGSIFEGIYTEIPVAVFCDDINKNKTGIFNTTQFELFKDGILPYTNNPNKIPDILNSALSEDIIRKQHEWNQKNFYHPEDPIIDFVNVIESYLGEDFDKRYYQMHKVFKDSYYTYINTTKKQMCDLNNQILVLNSQISTLGDQISKLQASLVEQQSINNDLLNNINSLNLQKDDLLYQIDFLTRQVDYYNNGALYKFAKKIYKLKNGE